MRNEIRTDTPAPNPSKRQSPLDCDPSEWRRHMRARILHSLIEQTADLSWSPRLISLLLDELHISDEFDRLNARVPSRPASDYPQLVAIAVLLRHSWCPRDLARTARRLGLSSTSTNCEPPNTTDTNTGLADPATAARPGRRRQQARPTAG